MTTRDVTAEVRRRVLDSNERFWRPDDFHGSPDAVAQALSRLVRAGELRRVRRGLYWRGMPTVLGIAPPPPGRLAEEIAGTAGTGPAGWNAALALGLSTQVPRHDTVAISGRAPRSLGPVHFVSRAASTKRRDEGLRPAEIALLEVLRGWPELVSLPTADATDRIAMLAENGTIRLDRLARASGTEPPRVRERLRRLLRALGRPDMVQSIRPARSRYVHRDLVLAD